jgi:hypothetical protein
VALLTPLPEGSPLDRLRAAGEIESASDDPDDLPEPLLLAAGTESASSALRRLRRDER